MVDFSKHLKGYVAEEPSTPPAQPEFISPWGDPVPTFTYLCGPAGSGKTFQTKLWAEEAKGITLCATTGIAALNLGGTTINSLLGYFDTISLQSKFMLGQLTGMLKRLYASGMRRIILDEVSMLDGDQLTYLVRAIEEVNGHDYFQDDDEQYITREPLGLTLTGDFAQLPPVKAIYAFESPEWGRFAANTHALTEIRRQADPDFIEALRAARRGDGRKALEFFRSRLIDRTDDSFEGTTLFAKNDSVDRYNQLRLDKLSTPLVFYKSERWGKQRSEWGNPEKAPYTWGIPQRLPLKVGSWVMILTNVWLPGRPKRPYYVNGDCGEVTEANPEDKFVKVRLERTGQDVSVDYCHREVLIPIDAARRKELREAGQGDKIAEGGKYEIAGAIDYMPIRLAWASTTHKSQGLSLDRLQVNINDPFFKSHGMIYVALSRARTAEGLHVIGRPETFIERCAADPKLAEWL